MKLPTCLYLYALNFEELTTRKLQETKIFTVILYCLYRVITNAWNCFFYWQIHILAGDQ